MVPFGSPCFTCLADVNRTFHTGWIRYSQAKLSAILFSRELNKRAEAAGQDVRSIAVHPGFVNSELYKNSITGVFKKMFIGLEEGAYSSVYAVADPEPEQKKLW